MKNKIRKPIAAFMLLAVMLIIMGIVVFFTSIYSFEERSLQRNSQKLEGAVNTLRQISANQDGVVQNQINKYSNYVNMICAALMPFASDDGYEGPDIIKNSLVVRVKDDQIIYPDGSPAVFPDLTTRETGRNHQRIVHTVSRSPGAGHLYSDTGKDRR